MDKEHFRNKLLKLRKELQLIEKSGNDAAKIVELDQSSVGRLSRMDAMQAQAMSKESNRRREIKMKRIESALQRIENDEFGYCLSCEEEIAPKRLEFDPSALLCIECADRGEK
ncbi:RNA polymerase-binding transcription factor DksA [bacterium BMS3Bbin09]|nr:RNA polymerase-binding transcription factor DksA [bacterium BMS3Bbin09]